MNRTGSMDTPNETADFNQCQEAVRKLTEYLSPELRPDEEGAVENHLAECKGCFARFHFEETLLRTIRERADQVRAPGNLRNRILRLLGNPEEDSKSAADTTP